MPSQALSFSNESLPSSGTGRTKVRFTPQSVPSALSQTVRTQITTIVPANCGSFDKWRLNMKLTASTVNAANTYTGFLVGALSYIESAYLTQVNGGLRLYECNKVHSWTKLRSCVFYTKDEIAKMAQLRMKSKTTPTPTSAEMDAFGFRGSGLHLEVGASTDTDLVVAKRSNPSGSIDYTAQLPILTGANMVARYITSFDSVASANFTGLNISADLSQLGGIFQSEKELPWNGNLSCEINIAPLNTFTCSMAYGGTTPGGTPSALPGVSIGVYNVADIYLEIEQSSPEIQKQMQAVLDQSSIELPTSWVIGTEQVCVANATMTTVPLVLNVGEKVKYVLAGVFHETELYARSHCLDNTSGVAFDTIRSKLGTQDLQNAPVNSYDAYDYLRKDLPGFSNSSEYVANQVWVDNFMSPHLVSDKSLLNVSVGVDIRSSPTYYLSVGRNNATAYARTTAVRIFADVVRTLLITKAGLAWA